MNRFCAHPKRCLAPLIWLLGAAALAAQVDLAGLRTQPVRHEAITAALQALWQLPPPAATRETQKLRAFQASTEGEAKRAAGLLLGVALERARDSAAAAETYRAVLSAGPATPYAISARARLRRLTDGEKPEDLERRMSREPETQGWFLVGDRWQWTRSRQAALESLLARRADHLSIRFLELLHSKSTFPPAYSYLFVFLALGLGVKVLALPLSVKSAKLTVQLGRLRPEIERIHSLYRGDPARLQQETMALWQQHGIKLWGGCAVGLVDLIFVIWALVALADFVPRLALDGARFGWVSDLSQPNLGVVLLWFGVSLVPGVIAAARQPGQGAQMMTAVLFSGVLFVGIAWYWDWPAYVLIFWGLLSLLGVLMNLVLVPICAATTR